MLKINKGEYLEILLRSPKTILSTRDIVLLWGEKADNKVSTRLKSYVKNGKLIRVRRGIYAKNKEYNKYELANKINIPSYISFETVLRDNSVIFQFYSQVFVACGVSREIKISGQQYVFKKLNEKILQNNIGIININGYSIATKERAMLDTIFVNKYSYFDNTRDINWDLVDKILPIYNSKRLEEKVAEIKKTKI